MDNGLLDRQQMTAGVGLYSFEWSDAVDYASFSLIVLESSDEDLVDTAPGVCHRPQHMPIPVRRHLRCDFVSTARAGAQCAIV
jgi:hypothetical protein